MATLPNRLVAIAFAAIIVASSAGVVSNTATANAAGSTPPLCSEPYLISFANWEFCWQLEAMRVQGLEINDVRYKGIRVLWKAGVPFSITNYDQTRAFLIGPFKDVLGTASEANVPGFGRGSLPISHSQCPRWIGNPPPTLKGNASPPGLTGEGGTLLQNGTICLERSRGPNPRVAIWSMFDAYNYRFIQGYIFHSDGRIEPKFALGGVLIDQAVCRNTGGSNCAPHAHNVYWRFDFDIAGGPGDTAQEFRRAEGTPRTTVAAANDPCRAGFGGVWCSIDQEGGRTGLASHVSKWRVLDSTSLNSRNHPRSYEVIPGQRAVGDAISSFDFWVLRYKGDSTEIGYEVSESPLSVDQEMLAYAMLPENTRNTDLVVWYVEHVGHEPRDEELPTMIWHELGPQLRPRDFMASNTVEPTF